MSPDKEVVLKNFGFASETNFMFYYILQLFLSLEEDRTHDPYNIEEEAVYALCLTPGRLPLHIKNFILWQCNLMQRDNGETLNIEMPRGLTKKYDVKASRLQDNPDKAAREAAIKACIDEVNDYLGAFFGVLAIVEATEDRFKTVEDNLLRAESMDSGLIGVLSEQKRVIEEMRMTITNLLSDLEDDVLPDLIKFEHTPDKAKALMVTLSDTNLKIRDAIRRHNLSQDY